MEETPDERLPQPAGDMRMKEQPVQKVYPLDGPEAFSPPRYFYGYVVVATCFLIQVIGWGIHNSYGIFFTPLVQEFGWSRASVAGAASMSLLVHGIGGVILGGLNDRVGPRLIMTGCGLFMGCVHGDAVSTWGRCVSTWGRC